MVHGRSSFVESFVWFLPFLCALGKEERREKRKEEKRKRGKEKREEEKKRETEKKMKTKITKPKKSAGRIVTS